MIFEYHVKTTGWIALGISPAGGMEGADIGLGWVDQRGCVHFQDRYAYGYEKPIVDNRTSNWFLIDGKEQDGWTAMRFRRLFDTCDSMDVSIKSGTNIIIYAYGLDDPNPDITYHQTRRGTRILPLRSYSDPPEETKFNGLDSVDFRLDNYIVPSVDTTYHCKVYKVPSSIEEKRHAIGLKYLIDESNKDLVHHMNVYECSPFATFDDKNLPNDVCNRIYPQLVLCLANAATAWAVGGDLIEEYPSNTGYPIGGNSSIKYYLIQIHYDNPRLTSNRIDKSGIRFYLGNENREHEIGYLSFGTDANFRALAIPYGIDKFAVDSYCPSNASQMFPEEGLTVISAFPHTHLQGRSVWTKIIRNKVAVDYLFNGESFQFNYQFRNKLEKPIQLYRGDEFVTRCIYSTIKKNETTFGGEKTEEEMCFHGFAYYPRMDNLYICVNMITDDAFKTFFNISNEEYNSNKLRETINNLQWTQQLVDRWQQFYNSAARFVTYGQGPLFQKTTLQTFPIYQDLPLQQCNSTNIRDDSTNFKCNSAISNKFNLLFLFFLLFFKQLIWNQKKENFD